MPKRFKPPKPKKTRRARGTGSIFPDARRGGYRAKVKIGRYPNGTTRYTEVHGATQGEVVEKMKLVLPPGPTTTLAQWAQRWLETAPVREQTRDLYRDSVANRFPALGHVLVAKVTPFDVEQVARTWAASGLAPNTVRKHLAHLQSCFAAAERADLVTRNPVKIARKPAGAAPDIDPLTPVELKTILATAASAPKTRRLAVMAATGCRIGEALALLPAAFDATTGLLTISETATRQHGHGVPKSKRSSRTIRAPKKVHAALAALGDSYTYTTALRHWNKLLAELGIRARGPHQARHSVATHMLARGVPMGDVAKYLGDTPATIIARYMHASGVEPCDVLDEMFEE